MTPMVRGMYEVCCQQLESEAAVLCAPVLSASLFASGASCFLRALVNSRWWCIAWRGSLFDEGLHRSVYAVVFMRIR